MKKLYLFISILLLLAYVECDNETTNKPSILEEEEKIQNIGKFWQITDIHWDMEYNEIGDPGDMCHTSNKTEDATGHFGNYLCDSPYVLVRSSVHAMKLLEPHPNFILWTGDNAPHTSHSEFSVIFETIRNVTAEMRTLFDSEIPIIPVLGNHDTYPRDEYPATGEKFYGDYLQSGNWTEIIPEDCHEDFKRGGYYKVEVHSQVDVLALNTNLYYRHNIMGQGLKDPGGQFKWLREILENARNNNRKVFIVAHSPPGTWERKPEIFFFNDTYNDEYVDILNEFGEQIIAQIYGHEHTDSFKLFGTSHDDIKSVGFLAPSVTPWHPISMEGGSAINPSVRLYTYSYSCITDYIQYHLNLTEANKLHLGDSCLLEMDGGGSEECSEASKNLWKEYYRATNAFEVKSLDVEEMKEVLKKLDKNDTYFQGYYTRNSAGINNGYCDDACKKNQICAISHQKATSLNKCLYSYSFNFDFQGKVILAGCIGSILLLTLAIVIYALILPRRNKNRKLAQDWVKNNRSGYRPLNTVDVE